jgi:hypothetical protein
MMANLNRANLSGANLSGANLGGAILALAELSRVNLHGAELSGIDLSEIDLSGADLRRANLTEAYLNKANLKNSDLSASRLFNAILDGADLTGAHLWEIQRSGWSIKGILCEYVYWDREVKEKTEYTTGEFEKLFAEQTKIRLFYKDGISPYEVATLPALIQHLEEVKGSALRLVSISEGAGGAVVELAIENIENQPPEEIERLQAALQTEAQQRAEYQRLALTEREIRLQLQGGLEESRRIFSEFIAHQKPTYLLKSEGDIRMIDDKGDTYNISGQAGAVGPNARAEHNTFNQTVNQGNDSLDLVALAAELTQLRIAIAKMQDPSPQAAIAVGEIAKAEIAAGEKDTPKVMGHLKVAGKWAFETATKIGTSIAAEVIKKSMEL